ncbi:hypothetical protein MRB53_020078 [Persea americana]|uniref:Uncharacterized protein n=1 Tax=Persea americana TaxID=3435 RepID=A0ACC2KZT4_PERAE|nr:hypothetical protein MRB53_020078 [Persea americana]
MKALMLIPLVLLLSGQSLTQGTGIVTGTCSRAAHSNPGISYDFCVAYLQANPRSATSELGELGLISLELALSYASHTNYHIKELMHETGLDPNKKRCLKDCLDLYTKAIDMVSKSEDALKAKRYGDVNEWVNSVMEGLDRCENGFNGSDLVSPLTEENKDLSQLGFIVLAITSFLG